MFLTVDVDELTVSSAATQHFFFFFFFFLELHNLMQMNKLCYVLQEFSTSWDIKATPTFFFLKDGQQIDKLVGANKPELQKKMTAILDSEAPSQA